jgi:antirestriction protein ArdC
MMIEDCGTWKMPWHTVGADLWTPTSVEGRRYTGGNRVALAMSAMLRGYGTGTWATYKAWQKTGAQVRKGEKATGILRPLTITRTDEDGEEYAYMRWAGLAVFNAAQVDGWNPTRDGANTTRDNADAADDGANLALGRAQALTDDAVRRLGIQVVHDPSRAYYSPSREVIGIPRREQFDTGEDFHSTMFHELTHATGPRLSRTAHKTWGDDAYAAEELVAELGAAFLMADVGLSATPRRDHAQYLQSWLRALKAQPSRLWSAASAAEKACVLLRGDVVRETDTTERETGKAA